MCRLAAADGITHAVATPHANDRYAYDRAYLSGLLDELREKVGPALQLQFSLGCDFHLSFENLERVLAQPHTYTIGETNYLLIELSNFSIPTRLSECFTRLGRSRTYADPDPSRAEPDPAANAAAHSGVGGTGLPDAGHGLGPNGALGRTARNHRPLAARPLGRAYPRLRRSRHQAPHPESFRSSRWWRKKSWEPSMPTRWSRATRVRLLMGCRSLTARGRCWIRENWTASRRRSSVVCLACLLAVSCE
jgi:hypothetical protein